MNYYHEIDNNDINGHLNTFNILICGQYGTGKSTFINHFIHEKVVKEGEFLFETHKIKSYIHPKYPIRIFDTPGFENDYSVKICKNTLEEFDKDMKDLNKHIDLIIYFKKLQLMNFYCIEENSIKWLFTENKMIIFVLSIFGNIKKADIMKSYEATKDYIKKIINPIEKDKLNKINHEKILDNIVIIKLKQSLDEYVDEDEEGKNKIKIKQWYGVDSLFIKIFDLFVNQRVSRYEIDKAKYTKEILNEIKKKNHLKK